MFYNVPKRNQSIVLLETCVKKQNQNALKVVESEGDFLFSKFFLQLLQTANWKEKSVGRMLFLACLVLTKAQTGECHSEAS